MPFWTYMLHCNGGAFYVGHTDNLERRVAEHEAGRFPGFTRDRLPVSLVRSQAFPTRLEALDMERRLKGWSRPKKLALIRGDWVRIAALAKGQTRSIPPTARERAEDGPSTSSGRTEDRS